LSIASIVAVLVAQELIEMSKREQLDKLFVKHKFRDFKWVNPRSFVVSEWVRMKCMFGCKEYGKNACCPPNTPSVSECRSFFWEYSEGVVFHFEKKLEKPEQRHEWTKGINERLLSLEREVFLRGNPKAFLLYMDSCNVCKNCAAERVRCMNKRSARPTPEAMAIDVFSTVRQLGYPIKVLRDYTEPMNRYAFLLVE
jgi:predicted metal-binding protein